MRLMVCFAMLWPSVENLRNLWAPHPALGESSSHYLKPSAQTQILNRPGTVLVEDCIPCFQMRCKSEDSHKTTILGPWRSLGDQLPIESLTIAPETLPTRQHCQRIVSCNSVSDNYRDTFQVN